MGENCPGNNCSTTALSAKNCQKTTSVCGASPAVADAARSIATGTSTSKDAASSSSAAQRAGAARCRVSSRIARSRPSNLVGRVMAMPAASVHFPALKPAAISRICSAYCAGLAPWFSTMSSQARSRSAASCRAASQTIGLNHQTAHASRVRRLVA